MTMAEKVKLHELRRFIYIYIYKEHLGLFIKYNDEVNLNVNGGGWGELFFPLKFNFANSLVSFMSFLIF